MSNVSELTRHIKILTKMKMQDSRNIIADLKGRRATATTAVETDHLVASYVSRRPTQDLTAYNLILVTSRPRACHQSVIIRKCLK